MFINPGDEQVMEILQKSRVIAVVGLSNNPARDSYRVAAYMKEQGYRIIPVNPTIQEALGEKAYPDLKSLPCPVDIVNVFRQPSAVPGVVEEALKLHPLPVIWLQLGVVHQEAALAARQAGATVIMDRCLMVEHRRLLGGEGR